MLLLAALFVQSASAQKTISLDLSKEHQTMDGTGGNMYGWITDTNKWSPSVLEKIISELTVTHVRFRSSIKLIEVANDNSDPYTINWSGIKEKGLSIYDFKMLQKLSAAGIECILGIWEVPDWMVTNPSSSTYRVIPPHMYHEFAELICAFLLYADMNYGVKINYIGIQNEPNIGIFDVFSPTQLVDVTKIIVNHLDHHGLSHVKLVVGDTNQPQPCVQYASPSLSCNDFNSRIAAYSYHTWHNMTPSILGTIKNHTQATGYHSWAAEVGASNLDSSTYGWAIGSLKNHHLSIKEAGSSMTFQWTLGGAETSIDKNGTPYPIFHALKHYHHHIKPGSVCVDTGADQGYLHTTAFVDKKEKKLSIVTIDSDSYGQTVTYKITNPGVTVNPVQVFKSTSAQQYSEMGYAAWDPDKSFSYFVDDQSIHTFTCEYNHRPTVILDVKPSTTAPGRLDYTFILEDKDGITQDLESAGFSLFMGGYEIYKLDYKDPKHPKCFECSMDPSGKVMYMKLKSIPKDIGIIMIGGGVDIAGAAGVTGKIL